MKKLAAVDCGEGNQRTGEEGCEGSVHFILYTFVFIYFYLEDALIISLEQNELRNFHYQ